MKYTLVGAACGSLLTASPVLSQSPPADSATTPDTAVSVSYGAFVDTYYAYDFSRPRNFDRSYTTQAARHNEFNVNLAFVEAKVSGPRVRGRLALQAGTSVQSNYAGEPTIGSVSGPSLSRFIQEAVAGYRITPNLWIDGGIFFSHIGIEGFISRDNLTYTRSLSADYTPYYESGARLTWQANPHLTGTFVVVNGWQNISENNNDKAVGARVDLAASSSTTFSYYNFAGKENADRTLRFFNGIGVKTTAIPGLTLQANGDYGMQDKTSGESRSSWYSAGVIAKVQPTPIVGISGRLETYHDPDQVIIVTGTDAGFKGTTASFGLDVQPAGSRAAWRNEVRGSWTSDPVFPARGSGLSAHDYVVVTSLAVTF